MVNSRTSKEVVAFCDFCRKEIQSSAEENVNPLSNSSSNWYFDEIKKELIQ